MCIVGRTKFSAVYVGLICRKVGAYGKISSPYAFIIGVKKDRTISVILGLSVVLYERSTQLWKRFFVVVVVVGGFGVWDIITWAF